MKSINSIKQKLTLVSEYPLNLCLIPNNQMQSTLSELAAFVNSQLLA